MRYFTILCTKLALFEFDTCYRSQNSWDGACLEWCSISSSFQNSLNNGMLWAPGGQGWNGVTSVVPPRLGVWRFTVVVFLFFVMLVFLFCKLFDHYSQTNCPIIKTTPFKVTQYKKVWRIFRPKVKIKIIVIILSLLFKNENKDIHCKYI